MPAHPGPHRRAELVARRLIIEADGGSRGNPGLAGYGAVVRDAVTGEVLAEVHESIGQATNNVAEYSGLLAGLRGARPRPGHLHLGAARAQHPRRPARQPGHGRGLTARLTRTLRHWPPGGPASTDAGLALWCRQAYTRPEVTLWMTSPMSFSS